MTNQEINEYLEEHLFGLIEKRKGSNCFYDIKRDEPRCTGCPDYMANYQPVLERIVKCETLVIFTVFYHPATASTAAEK